MRAWWWLAVAGCTSPASTSPMTKAELGSALFADQNLSQPAGQACADCHAQDRAFTDPESDYSTSMGAVQGRFGPRNAPSAMYLGAAPPLHLDAATHQYTGGLFWDGRADTLEAQAAKPLLNPLEMNNPDQATVVAAVRAASYAGAFRSIYGAAALDDDTAAFADVLDAIAAYERSPALSPFSSRYDAYVAGTGTLADSELRGLAIFNDPARGNCAGCHPPPLFTNFSYANLGIPTYAQSMYLAQSPGYIDHGLLTTTGDAAQDGKLRVPTLRNVAITGPYGHNGYFENLPYFLSFLATRDVGAPDTGAWAPPEVPRNLEPTIGHLPLSQQDLADLFAFLQTLTDGG